MFQRPHEGRGQHRLRHVGDLQPRTAGQLQYQRGGSRPAGVLRLLHHRLQPAHLVRRRGRNLRWSVRRPCFASALRPERERLILDPRQRGELRPA